VAAPFATLFGLLLLFAYPTGFEPLRFADSPLGAPLALLAALALQEAVSRRTRRAGAFFAALQFAVLVFVFHWPLWTWHPRVESSPALSTLAGLAPLLALQALHARRGPDRGFALRAALGLGALPLAGVLAIEEAFERIGPLREAAFVHPSLAAGAMLCSMVASAAALPALLRFVFRAGPLPPCPLRERLEARCRAMGLPLKEIHVVPAGPANAFVAGLGLGRRRVFLTRSLLEGMAAEEVEAVLAHEAAHAKRRHLETYLLMALSFALLSSGTHLALPELPAAATASVSLLAAALFWGGLFGWVSRRFETEADLDAAGEVGAGAMASALFRVAVLNGASPARGSLRHFSISRRAAILLGDPGEGERHRNSCRVARAAAGVLFSASVLLGAHLALKDGDAAEPRRTLLAAIRRAEEGDRKLREGRPGEARRLLREAAEGGADGAGVWMRLAEAEAALGHSEAAREAMGRARARGSADPRDRLRLK
jgi:Zn-dependent protease with chaperone function